MMEGLSVAMLLAPMLANELGRKFQMDVPQVSALTMVLQVSLVRLDFQQIWLGLQSPNLWYSLCAVAFTAGSGLYIYRCHWFKKRTVEKRGGFTINLYMKSAIDIFMNYARENPSMSPPLPSMDFGDPYLLSMAFVQSSVSFVGTSGSFNPSTFNQKSLNEIRERAEFVRPEADTLIYFKDPNFEIDGVYCWRKKTQKISLSAGSNVNSEATVYLPYLEISILNSSLKLQQPDKYISYIEKWLEERKNLKLSLYWVRVINSSEDGSVYRQSEMYNGERLTSSQLEKKYIDTFFQKDKQCLWARLKTIDQEPDKISNLGQFPQAGLLLHGPPGTGKSSFAFRVAMALGRHLFSVDIRTLPDLDTLHNITRKPWVNNKTMKPKDVVFVFDEFDLTVKELARRHTINDTIANRWFKDVTKFTSDYNPLSANEDEKKNTMNAMKLSSSGFRGKCDIQLNDLLEIFQGSVPSHQSIFIATTNNFQELQELCPALFRVGRLTPVLFDNFDLETLNEFTRFHFQSSFAPDDLPCLKQHQKMHIPPSHVVQILCDAISSSSSSSLLTIDSKDNLNDCSMSASLTTVAPPPSSSSSSSTQPTTAFSVFKKQLQFELLKKNN
jgi:DNA replication protein DnaC